MVSIVIPALNEERALPACLEAIGRELPEAEVLVVDGGSIDRTRELALKWGARVVTAHASRGGQCRVGAEAARGDLLCFFHADAVLAPGAGRAIRGFAGGRVATLRLDYRDPRLLCRYLGWTSQWDTYWTKFGDQGIVVHRALYDAIGGIPDMPLFEDVSFFRRARRQARIETLDARIIASTRRYDRAGLVRQLALNLLLMCLYRCRVSPAHLARWYQAKKTPARAPTAEVIE